MAARAFAAFERRLQYSSDAAQDRLRQHVALRAGHAIIRQEQIAVSRAGVKPTHKVYVDGRENAPLTDVKQKIEIIYDYKREIAKAAIRELMVSGPQFTGGWKKSILVFCNQRKIENFEEIGFNDEVWVIPTVPYARRLEVGKKKDGSPFIVQKEYQLIEHIVESRLRPRYRNYANVTFNHVFVDNGQVIKIGLRGSYVNAYGKVRRRRVWKDRVPGSALKYPAIIIQPVPR